jgi:hypothetical protein
MIDFYRRLSSGEQPKPAAVDPRDARLAMEQRQADRDAPRARSYWASQLPQALDEVALPVDQSADRDARSPHAAWQIPFEIESTQLEALARRHDTSKFTVCLALFQLLIHRLSASARVAVSVALDLRTPETRDEVGYFVNQAPAIATVDDRSLTLPALLAATKRQLAEIYRLRRYPFAELVGQAGLDRSRVIFNSVVQVFDGHNYLRKALRDAIRLLAPTGHVLTGDVMDLDLRQELVSETTRFRAEHGSQSFRTKTDWSTELFLSRRFFTELREEWPDVADLRLSKKTGAIDNELTKFRYDVLMRIDKEASATTTRRSRSRHDRRWLARHDAAHKPAAASGGRARAGSRQITDALSSPR